MTVRRAAIAVAVLACLFMPAAHAASPAVTIASFKYTPDDVQISVGDTIVWRNLDATVHTVTASRGEFSSGSMRQAQEFSATFTVPGVYPYFCEPHENMRGLVSVTGAAPATTTTAATPPTTLARAATTLVIPPTRVSQGTTTTTTTAVAAVPTVPPVVVAGPVTGHADQPSPVLPVAAVLVVVVALAAVLRDRLQYVAAAGTAATGLLHAQLRFALDYPEPIGTLLVIEAAGVAALAAWLVAHPWTCTKQLVAVTAHVAALGALAITRTSVGLFGFHEIGWDPSPQLPVAVTIGAVVIALLAATRTDSTATVA